MGLVVGPLGEGSKDLHNLVKVMAETRVASNARAEGRPASSRELGIVTGQIRRILSVTFVRAQAVCLLARVGYLGDGSKAAMERRDLTKKIEESRRRERVAHFQAHIRGNGLARVGQPFC